jgi:ribosomal protein S2
MSVLDPRDEDIQKMLAAEVHIGTTNSDFKMMEYIWKRRGEHNRRHVATCAADHLLVPWMRSFTT